MAKRGPNRKRRIPKLCFTTAENIGYYVTYRDPASGTPRKHRFGIRQRDKQNEAQLAYHKWLAVYLETGPPPSSGRPVKSSRANETSVEPRIKSGSAAGSVMEVASSVLDALEAKVRPENTLKARGTIARPVFTDRRKHLRDFLSHLNELHGSGAVSTLRITDLTMHDIESFNTWAVNQGYSSSQVSKRMQMVRALINRAGRPEHGGQLLSWNWESRDVAHGRPAERRTLPSLQQLQAVLAASDTAHRAMIWIAIGLGFGQRDIASIRVGQIDVRAYDMRRGKTGIERYGDTPPLVWASIQSCLVKQSCKTGELLFVTRRGEPLVHGRTDAISQWWSKLRSKLGETPDTLRGFYTLRHLGATEFGSRESCSIGEMRRWLGHSASSQMADIYMRPISPENREIIEWVRGRLQSTFLEG